MEVKGIDVSRWQKSIDWEQVAQSGIKFAMLRLGYGSKDGLTCGIDQYFDTNVKAAKTAGLDIGCYFYSYGMNSEAVKREAEFVIKTLANYPGVFTYPIVYDLEDTSQSLLNKSTLTSFVAIFCETLEKAKYYAMYYTNPNWIACHLDISKLTQFDLWLAQWADKPTDKYKMGIWQYSANGSISGITGNVDLDIAYKDYPAIIKKYNLNGFKAITEEPPLPFSDIENHWAEADIMRCYLAGVITGNGTKLYKPDEPLTRAEVAKLIATVLDLIEDSKM